MKTTAYIGCRTTKERNARGLGLKVYDVNSATGNWTEKQLLSEFENPSYLCFDQNEDYLYCVHGDMTSVSAFKISNESGELSLINTIDTVGKNPVFLTVDKSNQFLYVACLQGGAVYTLRRRDDGGLSEPIHTAKLPGRFEGGVSHAHQCLWDQEMAYLFVPAQGRGIGYSEINVFEAQPDGALEHRYSHRTRELDEARHVAVHPNNRYVYGINEKDNSVVYYSFDSATGRLEPRQILSTLPEWYVGEGQASAVLIHSSGKYLITTNRIHDSLTVFAVDANTGYLKCLSNTSCMGKTPRFATFNPEGNQLIVANEDSDTLQFFQINSNSGELTFTGQTVRTESPVCVIFRRFGSK
ncbi:lactonase family protein [Acidaminobacter hydrogenoformans]|uniref:6-phosphogluconolactonase, cycloisomerase 2 family n=1 Tax=Acidaminobacter hydrogenoformans DSM 2784 TaxID=1120920 RepID=A0A1G5S661_9FIRM|nr:lactonase family protein [Acidaminobacter hydrogenoformans]SCZ81806.1 6-phosphogluconolactonase, cycloisomerase 2 family [Acidaminobacter hydrogenoformans DSM 2784]